MVALAWLLLSCATDFPSECPRPGPCVRYRHETWEERDICDVILYACEDGEDYIEREYPECGCGCMCAGGE